jgi:hypothetical protein
VAGSGPVSTIVAKAPCTPIRLCAGAALGCVTSAGP